VGRGVLTDTDVYLGAAELDDRFIERHPAQVQDQSGAWVDDLNHPLTPDFHVLNVLAHLHMTAVVREDVPHLRALLLTSDAADGIARWDDYQSQIDWAARYAALADDPFHGPQARMELARGNRSVPPGRASHGLEPVEG
jgi:hypothetical protein